MQLIFSESDTTICLWMKLWSKVLSIQPRVYIEERNFCGFKNRLYCLHIIWSLVVLNFFLCHLALWTSISKVYSWIQKTEVVYMFLEYFYVSDLVVVLVVGCPLRRSDSIVNILIISKTCVLHVRRFSSTKKRFFFFASV